MEEGSIICPICKRNAPKGSQTKHHMVPKSKKGKITVALCRSCGSMVHKLFTNKELARKYNTIEALLETEEIQNWVKWVSKKPEDFTICMKVLKKRKK